MTKDKKTVVSDMEKIRRLIPLLEWSMGYFYYYFKSRIKIDAIEEVGKRLKKGHKFRISKNKERQEILTIKTSKKPLRYVYYQDDIKDFVLLIGASGTGKTTVANILEEEYGLKQVDSLTTRPRRHDNENGHTFISDEEFEKIKGSGELLAFLEYSDYKYGITSQLIDSGDICVVDPVGAKDIIKNYRGDKVFKVFTLNTTRQVRHARLMLRGDNLEGAQKRVDIDDVVFDDAIGTVLDTTRASPTETAKTIQHILEQRHIM